MSERRRLFQYLHARDTIDILVQSGKILDSLDHASLITLIMNENRVLEGVSPGRYAAMLKSIIHGRMNDTDVRWH